MRLLIILGLLATPFVSAVVYQDLELGAIVIDDSPDESLELDEPEVATTEATGNCANSNGVSGTCKKMSECFPYFDEDDYNRYELNEILKAAAEPCEGEDGLVCCPNFSYGLPSRKPQFAGQTSERPSATNSTVPPKLFGVKNDCSSSNVDLKVVGGREAVKHEFPYMAALINKGRQFCGGSLINEQWVLTAAHCIASLKSLTSVKVYLGDHDVTTTSDASHQSRGIKRGYYNKGFSMGTLQHDIALLQLDQPVSLSDTVQTVCLSDTEPPYGDNAILSGWGKTSKNQGPSPKLRTVTMRIIPHEECKQMYASEPNAPRITDNMVCSGERMPNGLKDACNGDSGGPLAIQSGGKAVQIGIVSWGIGCGDKHGVYTKVNKYLQWIDKTSRRAY